MDYLKAITKTHPNAVSVTEIGGVYTALDKDGNSVAINQSLADEEALRIKEEWDASAYARNRKAEYPSIEECVHAILDDDLEALQVKRAEIKARYPK